MIVIPMAGASRRFTEAGYARPKYELPLAGRTVFDHAVGGFEALFAREPFLFIVMGGEAASFVEAACARLGIARFQVVSLAAPTAGQAETVALGIDAAGTGADGPLTIFNIDTFRPGYTPPIDPWLTGCDGWLEVFRGEGANWSYVRPAPGPEPRALETAEKRPISDLCCTGLYHFASAADFQPALAAERAAPSMNELYVAPLYNHLIAAGRRIGYRLIARDEVVFCGTPEEYRALGGDQA
jgi:hypothetical protein